MGKIKYLFILALLFSMNLFSDIYTLREAEYNKTQIVLKLFFDKGYFEENELFAMSLNLKCNDKNSISRNSNGDFIFDLYQLETEFIDIILFYDRVDSNENIKIKGSIEVSQDKYGHKWKFMGKHNGKDYIVWLISDFPCPTLSQLRGFLSCPELDFF